MTLTNLLIFLGAATATNYIMRVVLWLDNTKARS